jgi:hypothetical protein
MLNTPHKLAGSAEKHVQHPSLTSFYDIAPLPAAAAAHDYYYTLAVKVVCAPLTFNPHVLLVESRNGVHNNCSVCVYLWCIYMLGENERGARSMHFNISLYQFECTVGKRN